MNKDRRLYGKFTLDFPDSDDVLPLSDAAFRGLVEMVLWCHRERSCGVVDTSLWSAEVVIELREMGHIDLVGGTWVVIDIDSYPKGGSGRPRIPTHIRRAVMERDGYECTICSATDALSLDHIVRYRDGGPDTVENLRVLCMPCNLDRG